MLLVGNHSGGNMSPDTLVFTLAFTHVLRCRAALSPARPQPRAVDARRWASCASTASSPRRRRTPTARCASGAALLVYPGGDHEVHRPSWERNEVNFDGRRGFVRLALEHDVPIVPVVVDRRPGDGAVPQPRRGPGAHAHARPAAAPEGAADLDRRAVGPERRRRARPHPAAGEDHRRGAAGDPPARAVRPASPTSTRSTTTSRARCRRRSTRSRPSGGCRSSDEGPGRDRRRRAAGPRLGLRHRSHALPALHERRHALGGHHRAGSWPRRALPHAHARRLGRGRRARRGRRVRRATRPRLDLGHRHRPARPLAPARTTPAARSTRVELRMQYGIAGSGIIGWIAEQVAAPAVRENLRRSLQELRRQAEHEQARARGGGATRRRPGRSDATVPARHARDAVAQPADHARRRRLPATSSPPSPHYAGAPAVPRLCDRRRRARGLASSCRSRPSRSARGSAPRSRASAVDARQPAGALHRHLRAPAGQVVVAQTSVIGSLFANALLVLGS